uniref:Uncharacterized protein n=1 Tax=Rhizophora mucronata TaxID=61149 RepID=A0A2P2PD63_RHIMU
MPAFDYIICCLHMISIIRSLNFLLLFVGQSLCSLV